MNLQQQAEVMQQVLLPWGEANLAQRYMPLQQQQEQQHWQPSDLLPDAAASSAGGLLLQQLGELRAEAGQLPAELLVVLAGLAVNAALVPNQLSSSWGGGPLRDHSGADGHAWARWRRRWAADVNSHRVLLSTYCYCCGAIDMRALETSTQLSIAAGCFNGGPTCWSDSSSSSSSGGGGSSRSSSRVVGLPYQQLLRELLQARMLRVMYTNLSRLAAYHGAPRLSVLTTALAADSRRHEAALVGAACSLFEADPTGVLLALEGVVRGGLMLPGAFMTDGWHETGNAGGQLGGAGAAAAAAFAGGPTSRSSSSSSSEAGGAGVVPQQQQQQQQQQQHPAHSGSHESPEALPVAPQQQQAASQLYVDFMAAADCLGVYCLSDLAAAVEECCELWGVQQMHEALQDQLATPQAPGPNSQVPTRQPAAAAAGAASWAPPNAPPMPAGPAGGADQAAVAAAAAAVAAAQWLLRYPALLRRLSEVQLEGRLRARRRGRPRSRVFSWLRKREVLLA